MIMAKHETMSAWFWITNSWLSTGGLLFFLRKPMAHIRGGSPSSGFVRQLLHRCCRPAPLNCWMFSRLWDGRSSAVRKHSELPLMCLKTVMKMYCNKTNTPQPTFCFLQQQPGKVRWRALPLQNPIHEPPTVIDVEGEPGPVVSSGTPPKHPIDRRHEWICCMYVCIWGYVVLFVRIYNVLLLPINFLFTNSPRWTAAPGAPNNFMNCHFVRELTEEGLK